MALCPRCPEACVQAHVLRSTAIQQPNHRRTCSVTPSLCAFDGHIMQGLLYNASNSPHESTANAAVMTYRPRRQRQLTAESAETRVMDKSELNKLARIYTLHTDGKSCLVGGEFGLMYNYYRPTRNCTRKWP